MLGYLEEIPVCVAYEIQGKRSDTFPVPAMLDQARPVLETLPGWRTDISDVRLFDELPQDARAYVRRVEQLVGVAVSMISVGPERDAIIRRAS